MSAVHQRPADDVRSEIRVDGNDRQVVIAVEDASAGSTTFVAAVDPLVDRRVLAGLVDELVLELARIHPDAPELVADALLEDSA